MGGAALGRAALAEPEDELLQLLEEWELGPLEEEDDRLLPKLEERELKELEWEELEWEECELELCPLGGMAIPPQKDHI
jgi:hypothetical protein